MPEKEGKAVALQLSRMRVKKRRTCEKQKIAATSNTSWKWVEGQVKLNPW